MSTPNQKAAELLLTHVYKTQTDGPRRWRSCPECFRAWDADEPPEHNDGHDINSPECRVGAAERLVVSSLTDRERLIDALNRLLDARTGINMGDLGGATVDARAVLREVNNE